MTGKENGVDPSKWSRKHCKKYLVEQTGRSYPDYSNRAMRIDELRDLVRLVSQNGG